MTNLNDIKEIVLFKYPFPIASIFNRYICIDEDDVGGRHKLLIDLFEALIKLLCIIQIQEAIIRVPDFKEQLPGKENSLEFLKHPSLGSFTNLLREFSHIEYGDGESCWIPKISKWYNYGKSQQAKKILSILNEIDILNIDTQNRKPNSEILRALVFYRNKQIAHGGTLTKKELLQRLSILEKILAYLLISMDFLAEMVLFQIDEAKRLPDGRELLSSKKFIGLNPQPIKYYSKERLELSELYLTDLIEGEFESLPINLTPLLLLNINERTNNEEIYYYNDALRTKLEYVSYSTGTHYYHKELHERFGKLINLQIKLVPEQKHESLKPNEKEYKYDYYYKKALKSISNNKLEEGAEYLECALNYLRKPIALIELAKTQYSLKDHKDAIVKTLENCLELEPDNQDALNLISLIDQDLQINQSSPGRLSYFHLFIPYRFYSYPLLWIGFSLFIYYLFSIVIDISHKSLLYLCCLHLLVG